MTAIRPTALLLALGALAGGTLAQPAAAASRRAAACQTRPAAPRGRRAPRARGCVPRTRRGPGAKGPWRGLDGARYEFEDLQISGTMTAAAPADAGFDFTARSTTIIRPKARREGGVLRRDRSDVGGRFRLQGSYVLATARPVDYGITSTARWVDGDRVVDCSWNRPAGIDTLGLQIYPERNRIAIRYSLYTGGWACRHETTDSPSCGQGTGGDASVMFYKEIEFTRRWIKLPIDLRWRTGENVGCEFRWNGWVRLKKLRPGE